MLSKRICQPFIKWAGGKRNLLSQILPLLPKEFENYFEPFLGGGALFFELFSLGRLKNKKAYLFDINVELINTYEMVKNNPNALIVELQKFKKEHSKEFYYEVREWDRESGFKEINALLRATRFIYLNKTCFNGLYRVNKEGFFNVPMGAYKDPKICDVEVISNSSYALQNATIKHTSYEEVLKLAHTNDLIYFDPPYYPLNETSSFAAYSENEFLEKEQKELFRVFDTLAKKQVKVFLSNSNTPFILDLYQGYKIEILKANRCINSKGNKRFKIDEVLIQGINNETRHNF
ncbi:DNA adenine methylase [Helicobacter cetorum]|uniref:Site-specific DNA-methyltransferase (adenine-specific) n=1 Tax=Helicobacter cetorum (strain ATCC BAA-429 / MIT 00-7128) TaxID=182217 RepID=I0EKS4_HELC0|nr:DNA adenine methylase [Helicobacter cetorum]AFI03543.1 DNA adenine methylase [Helicobacter cetorum MIT 00-7128]